MDKNYERIILLEIVRALEEAGYDPLTQLCGYLKTGRAHFITRRGGARKKIEEIDPETIYAYLDEMKKPV